jgi:16S rRNA (adenine1518-N6/adenine1519-N6)-dimethyltransferase
VLGQYGVRPRKALGQSFLRNPEAREQILQAADLGGSETVLEIGPGLGALTWELCRRVRRVIAVELDARLLPPLRALLAGCAGVELMHGDILEIGWQELRLRGPFCVVANIPYSITSALLRRLLEAPEPARWLVLTVQREVAERVIAEPGEMSLLALSVQLYGVPRLLARLPAEAFYPEPEVESAVLRIDIHPSPPVAAGLMGPLFRAARAGFAQRRKKLRNALSAGLAVPTEQAEVWLREAGIAPDRRAQALKLDEWARLAEVIGRAGPE